MIYGIGADIVQAGRIARLLEQYGDRFARRLLAADEWRDYLASPRPVFFLANRFAAKEAFAKALGTGMRYPVTLRRISVGHDGLGKPLLRVSPEVEELLGNNGVIRHHLTISDEKDFTLAFVVLES